MLVLNLQRLNRWLTLLMLNGLLGLFVPTLRILHAFLVLLSWLLGML